MRRMNIKVWGVILLCLLWGSLGVGAVAAQNDECPEFTQSLDYGDETTGEINGDSVFLFYCFQGERGDALIIDVETTDGDLDPYLLLSDITVAEFYAKNDNVSSRNLDSHLEYTLEDDAIYIITVTRVGAEDGESEGEFSLRLESDSQGVSPNVSSIDGGQCPQGSNLLIAGYSLTGSINDDNYLRSYCFFGLAGTEYRVTVETTKDDLDPLLVITSADLADVFVNNDNATSRTTDARADFIPEADGVYMIIVSRLGLDEGDTAGEYLISLDNRTTDEPDSCADALTLPPQGLEIGRVDQVFLHLYCFNGSEDDDVTFTATAQRGDLDMITFITDPNLETIEQAESKNESMELTATIPEDGPYLIMVFDLTGEGRFDMTFEGGAGSGSNSSNSGGSLSTIFGSGNNEPEPSGDCEDEPLSFLIAGNWSSTNSAGTTEMKFDCDGNVSVTVNGNTFEATYSLENDTLTLSLDDGDVVVEGVLLTRTALIGTSDGNAFMLLNRSR